MEILLCSQVKLMNYYLLILHLKKCQMQVIIKRLSGKPGQTSLDSLFKEFGLVLTTLM